MNASVVLFVSTVEFASPMAFEPAPLIAPPIDVMLTSSNACTCTVPRAVTFAVPAPPVILARVVFATSLIENEPVSASDPAPPAPTVTLKMPVRDCASSVTLAFVALTVARSIVAVVVLRTKLVATAAPMAALFAAATPPAITVIVDRS